MEKDYKEKIRKLLALAESPNEHEARAALLKARELMAEYKLTEAEIKDAKKQEVREIMTDVTCSKRRHPWIIHLSAAIGENYCCKAFRKHGYGEQTQHVGFIGLEDDVEICVAVFNYAVDCVLSQIRKIKADNACYYSSYINKLCNSYGYGFYIGLAEAFKRQQAEKEQEWGLVLVLPKEVQQATEHFRHQEFRSKKAEDGISGREFLKGLRDGREFDPARRLQEETVRE